MYIRHLIGRKGEDIAVRYLEKEGYRIICRNFLCKLGELDIIALNSEYLVFVEVKTRTNDEFGKPVEAITKKKLQSIYKSAKVYVHLNRLENKNIRFDVIEVYYGNNNYKINHIKQII